MAKIYSYGSARTYPVELIPTDSSTLKIGDLVVITSGKVVAAGSNEPTYIVVGATNTDGNIPVAAILDDMVLESATAITGFTKIADNRYRKDNIKGGTSA